MEGSDPRNRFDPFETLSVDILGFAFLILLLIVLAVVVSGAFAEATWYLPDEAVAVLAGLIGFYLLVANEKIRKALMEAPGAIGYRLLDGCRRSVRT